jgi:hypothetical protein
LEKTSAKLKKKNVVETANKIKEATLKITKGFLDAPQFSADMYVETQHKLSKMQTMTSIGSDDEDDFELVIAKPLDQPDHEPRKKEAYDEEDDDQIFDEDITNKKPIQESQEQIEEQNEQMGGSDVFSETFPEPISQTVNATLITETFQEPLQPTLDATFDAQAPSIEISQQQPFEQYTEAPTVEATFQEPLQPTLDATETRNVEQEPSSIEQTGQEEEEEEEEETEEEIQQKLLERQRHIEAFKQQFLSDKKKKKSQHGFVEDECEEGEEDEEGNFIAAVAEDDEANINEEQMVAEMADFIVLEGEEIEKPKPPTEEENVIDDFDSSDDEDEQDEDLIVFDNDSEDEIIDDRAMDMDSLRVFRKKTQKSPAQDQKQVLATVLEQSVKTNYSFMSKRSVEMLKMIQQQFDLTVDQDKENVKKDSSLVNTERLRLMQIHEKEMETKLLRNVKDIQNRQRARKRSMASQETISSQDSEISSLSLMSTQDEISQSPLFQSMSSSFSASFASASQSSDRPSLKRKREDARGSFLRKSLTEEQQNKIRRMKLQQKSGTDEQSVKSAVISFGSPKPVKSVITSNDSTGKKKATPKKTNKDGAEPVRKRKRTA